MSVVNRRMALAVCLILAVAFSVFTQRTSAQTAVGGRLRFVHAIPGAPPVDISIDKVVAARSLEYAQATRFLNVPAGDHTVVLSASGTTAPLFQGKVSVGAGQAQTVITQGIPTAI